MLADYLGRFDSTVSTAGVKLILSRVARTSVQTNLSPHARSLSIQKAMHKLIAAHLDLKGVSFKPAYDHEYLENLHALAINTLIVEYEDAFPFEGFQMAHDKHVVWSRRRLSDFQKKAASLGIEIIPLQQTLGHLEYVFRWQNYASYTLPGHPSTLDIWNKKAVRMIDEMLRQVIAAHPDSRFVHVGMDEAHSLIAAAKARKAPVLSLYFERLESICQICEQYGKTPIIFSDMLEEHFSAEALERLCSFKTRLVLQPWDYQSTASTSFYCRFGGTRVAQHWKDRGSLPETPPMGIESLGAVEELPEPILRLVRPYFKSHKVNSLCQVAIWLELGFRVFGATAVRISSDGQYLIPHTKRLSNIRTWAKWLRHRNFIGLMATSWARGNSCCRPNAMPEVTWGVLQAFSRQCGRRPAPFFGEIDTQAQTYIAQSQSFLEGKIDRPAFLKEANALAPKIESHSFEWRFFCLILEMLILKEQGDLAQLEVDDYLYSKQLSPQLWQRRIADQDRYILANRKLKTRFKKLLLSRYRGNAVEEWLSGVFNTPCKKLTVLRDVCLRKLDEAKKIYN